MTVTMLSRKTVIFTTALLCFSAVVNTEQVRQSQVRKTFDNEEVILDNNPVQNNTLLYGTCRYGIYRHDMKCKIILEKFDSCSIIANKTCELNLMNANEERRFGDLFHLTQLNNESVVFAYASENIDDTMSKDYSMTFRILHMSTCQESAETNIDFGSEEPKLHFVSYSDTFDLFYENKTLCGDTMCGQTHDCNGNLINGPVPSFLSSSLFHGESHQPTIHPVRFQSSMMGHYVISDKIRLVSSYGGTTTVLLSPPSKLFTFAPSRSSNGSYGFCSASTSLPYYVNCKIFDSHGNLTLDTNVSVEHEVTGSMKMYIFNDGGFLLLVRQCISEYRTCRTSFDKFSYYVVKVDQHGKSKKPREIKGVDCQQLQDDKIEFNVSDNGEACANAVCHGRPDDKRVSYLDLKSRCISI